MSLDGETTEIPSPSTSFDAYQVALQEAAVGAIKSSMRLPKDLSYHRSLDRKFGKRLDASSERILALTARLLEFSEVGNAAEGAPSKAKGKRKLETEEDVVDGFHSLVVDVMDQLLERTDTCLDEFLGRTKPPAISVNPQAQPRPKVSKLPRGRLDPALAHASHLPKPQLLFHAPVANTSTTELWQPQLKIKPHAIVPLEQSSVDESASSSVPHPYRYEITHLTPPDYLLDPPASPTVPEPLATAPPVTYISHASQLPTLLEKLKHASEIAVDLEHHSYRSFGGFVCLMQLSTRTQDCIIDCLDPAIRADLECLNDVFADPNIVKVFHGAESDIVWLQQNFNLYVVNLFDTYHATKVLDFPKHSLAALLEMFCDFTPDKRYQLADWRIRPLPADMLLYARADTHFLLFIYDNLRAALQAPGALRDVLARSCETALRVYVREAYDAAGGTGMGGWEALLRKWNRGHAPGSGAHAVVFRAVHAWRDAVARAEDESTRYVLPNHYLFSLAERPPTDLPGLLATFQPVPPLVRARSLELLEVIKDAVQRAGALAVPTSVPAPIRAKEKEPPRLVGAGEGEAPAGLWDRLRPVMVPVAASSALFGGMLPRAGVCAAEKSSLFGAAAPRLGSVADARYRALVTRIHSSLIVAPTIKKVAPDEQTPASAPDPAAQDEVPYVPPAQRQPVPAPAADPDSIVVVGQRHKKRKRPAKSAPPTAEDGEILEVFDYDAVPSMLDTPVAAAAPPLKKRREKGGVQYGNFPAPPRNMSEMKSGNQAGTFR